MRIELTAEAEKNVRWAAKKAGRTAQELAADAVAAAFAHVAEARRAERRESALALLDGADAAETVGALRARVTAAEKAAE